MSPLSASQPANINVFIYDDHIDVVDSSTGEILCTGDLDACRQFLDARADRHLNQPTHGVFGRWLAGLLQRRRSALRRQHYRWN